jgi:hypothetical protein
MGKKDILISARNLLRVSILAEKFNFDLYFCKAGSELGPLCKTKWPYKHDAI